MIKAGSKYKYGRGVFEVEYNTAEIPGTLTEGVWWDNHFDWKVPMTMLVDSLKAENKIEQDNKTTIELKVKVDTSELDAALEKVKEFNKELAKVSPPNNFVRKVLGEPIVEKLHYEKETTYGLDPAPMPKYEKVHTKNELYIGMKVPYLDMKSWNDFYWVITGFCGEDVYASNASGTYSNNKISIKDVLLRLNQE